MKGFIKQFMYVPKHGKVSDKTMLGRAIFSAVFIIGCLVAMTFSAYAYFSHSVVVAAAPMEAADFEGEVKAVSSSDEEIIFANPKTAVYEAELTAGEYEITVGHKGSATTGFFKVETQKNTYHTSQLFSAQSGKNESITFKIKLDADAKVVISANWGTSAYYSDYTVNGINPENYITDGETVG